MKRLDLTPQKHNYKPGKVCDYIEPNVNEDVIFYDAGVPIGFFLRRMPEKMCQLATIANHEFRSDRVPKSLMKRSGGLHDEEADVSQYSTILGAVPPKPHMKRNYATISSVHREKQANRFIKAMWLLAEESEQLIRQIMPEQYEQQKQLFEDVDPHWRFANLFTSSISNYNISASYHTDHANIKGAVNVIICKQKNSRGGDLNIPDYGATIGQVDNSMLVYPAWRNLHGVTPITVTYEGGYRNSLIFYPLKAFKGLPAKETRLKENGK